MKLLNLILKIQRKLYLKQLQEKVGHKLRNVTVKGKLTFERCSIEMGENVVLYPDVSFTGNGKIMIGNNVKIGKGVIIYANEKGGVEIGDNTIIAAQTYIIDSNHGCRSDELISSQPLEAEKIVIGSDVWIGADVTVIKGAYIKNGAVIGAKSLVNGTIEENGIAVGVPAKIREYRENK